MVKSIRSRWLAACVFAIVGAPAVFPQTPVDAKWIWRDEPDPGRQAAVGKVWFRREVRGHEPSTGILRVACDDAFVLWVNGTRIGSGGGAKSHRFLVSGLVERGLNVIAVEATNDAGRAGLLVAGEIRGQSGSRIPVDTGPEWRATTSPPTSDAWKNPGFDDSSWKPVKVIGDHQDSPWKEIRFGDGALDRFQTAPGFELERIAEPQLVGSLVAMTWGQRGRLIASKERGPVQSVIDADGDGKFDQVVIYSDQVTNCQGLCMVGDDLYAVGDGPKGTGLYRLPDKNGDDRADEVQLITTHRGGMGEHGPHAVVFGPDGWLYHNLGNHSGVTHAPEPTSPIRGYDEGDLLRPRFEDGGGHAVGVKAPGGTIWRLAPDGKRWWLVSNGFRNHYDVAFNQLGELFTFDSDMEWDVGLPWYRPVRVNHCLPGAEFGWRSGAAKWPEYYFDSLPTTVDIGRGSPTGVVFYEHHQFPEKYRGAFLICDWSMGRIIAVYLKPHGATFAGSWDNLVLGNPLNVSDIEVDRDGSVVFCTGGRGTEGGIYRVRHAAGKPILPKAETVADALGMPQPSAGWARAAIAKIQKNSGGRWEKELQAKAKTGSAFEKVRALSLLAQFGPKPGAPLLIECTTDSDPRVRSFATWLLGDHSGPAVAETLSRLLADADAAVRRRACEASVRSGLEPPIEPVLRLLASDDRWLRFAARIALEHVPAAKWQKAVLEANQPPVELEGLLALHRSAPQAIGADVLLARGLAVLQAAPEDRTLQVDALRLIELALLDGAKGPAAEQTGRLLLKAFPTGFVPFDREAARLLAALQVPGAAAKLMQQMEQQQSQSEQLHYVLALSYLKVGRSPELNRRLVEWYEKTGSWEGGHSMQPYLANIMTAHWRHYPAEQLARLLLEWRAHPFAARLLLGRLEPAQVAGFPDVISRLLTEFQQRPDVPDREQYIGLALEALGRSPDPAAQALLRRMYEEQPDRRGQIARSLAKHPQADNAPFLVRTLQFADPTTMQVCLQSLRRIERKPETPDEVRTVILAGLRLGEHGGLAAAGLLEQWTGSRHGERRNASAALTHYQRWFRAKYPDEPDPELPRRDGADAKYSYQQLVDFLENSPQAQRGNADRGRAIFAKADCIKCHRFGNDGEGVGPDLTTVRRRFQSREILDSLAFPSQVISDQYRAITVATVDGLVHTGMPLPSPPGKIVLLLSDATRLEIAKRDVQVRRRAKVSIMPENLLDKLTLAEIADLFAFLETSKNNPEPTATATGNGR